MPDNNISSMQPAVEVLENIVWNVVKYPEAVKVVASSDDRGNLLTLTVDPSDMGTVIGRGGQMIDKIRLIIKTVGIKHNMFIALKVIDPRSNAR